MRRRDLVLGAGLAAVTAGWPMRGEARSVRQFRSRSAYSAYALAFSPDGRTFLAGYGSGDLLLWDVARARVIRSFPTAQSGIDAVAMSRDGRLALSGGKLQSYVRLWDVASGALLRTFEDANAFDWSHRENVKGVALAPDASLALSCSETVKIWRTQTGELLRTFEEHNGPVNAVAFSPDGTIALSGGNEGSVLLWEVASGKVVHNLQGQRRAVFAVAFGPDGRTAVSGSLDGELVQWDLAAGKKLRSFGNFSTVNALTVASDGRTVLVASGNTLVGNQSQRGLTLWNVESGKELRRLGGQKGPAYSVALAPDGRHALSGDSDGITLWDLGAV